MVALPIILGIAPALFWLLFFLIEDRVHPEPKRMIVYVFLAGGISAILAAFPELYIQKLFPATGGLTLSSPLIYAFAFIEEFAKFIVVYLIIKKNKYFDERVDAMIYMITAGLGFAALENVLNLLGSNLLMQVILVRGIGATLLHALASGILGFYWIRGRLSSGVIAARILHGLFNYLILAFQGFEIYASILLLFAAIIIFHDFEILKKEDRQDEVRKSKRFALRR